MIYGVLRPLGHCAPDEPLKSQPRRTMLATGPFLWTRFPPSPLPVVRPYTLEASNRSKRHVRLSAYSSGSASGSAARADPGARRRDRDHATGVRPVRVGLPRSTVCRPRAPADGRQRRALPHPPGHHRGGASRVSGGRRRPDRDQHVQRSSDLARGLWVERRRLRNKPRGGRDRACGSRRVHRSRPQ